MTASPAIEITVVPQREDCRYRACWPDGETLLTQVPESFLDLIGFMLARRLLEQGYAVERIFIVRLQGADFELMRCPLGTAAAAPLINYAAPVKGPTRALGVVSA
jgi:hypothetical protein